MQFYNICLTNVPQPPDRVLQKDGISWNILEVVMNLDIKHVHLRIQIWMYANDNSFKNLLYLFLSLQQSFTQILVFCHDGINL